LQSNSKNLCIVDSAIYRLGIGLQTRYLDSEKIKFSCAKTFYASLPITFPSCTFFPIFSSLPGRFYDSKDSHMSSNNTLSPTSPRPTALPPPTFPSSTFYTNFSSLLGKSSKSKESNMFFHNNLSQNHSPPPAITGKKASYREILAQNTICWHKR
jgi:hypothetical protein